MQTEGTALLGNRARIPAASAAAAATASSRQTAREAEQTAAVGVQSMYPAAAEEGCAASPTAAESGATLSDDRSHPQQQQVLLEKRATTGERLQGERHGAEADDVLLSVDDEGSQSRKENDARLVIAAFVLSFLFPPIGCLFFCLNLSTPPDSPRYVWAVRALEVGSLLSFVYSLVIIMILSDFTLVYSQNKAHFGVGF